MQVRQELLDHGGRAADAMEVAGDVLPARRQRGDDRRRAREPVEIVQGQRDAGLLGEGEQVEDAVRRAARPRDADDRVLERLARDEGARAHVSLDDVEREPPGGLARCRLARVRRGHAAEPDRPEPEEVDRSRHRVRGEVARARARAGAGVALERVELFVGDRASLVCADRLPDVLDRHLPPLVLAGRHRPGVEDEAGQVEAEECHHRPRHRLVAADEADEAVEALAAPDELDRVRDHLPRDQRRPHPVGAHRQVVRDRDRVELERRPTCGAHPGGDVLGEVPLP